MKLLKFIFLVVCIAGFVLPAFAIKHADTTVAQPRISVTSHQGVFNGKKINYTATVRETFLSLNKKVSTGSSIITTSYVQKDAANPSARPVIFIFNGGPGASSSPLHMHALGPYQIVTDPKTNIQSISNNPLSLLDAADLVFIDPAGTGYTNITDSVTTKAHWDVEQDARAIIDIIRSWLQTNNRGASRVYICGQSYGTTRAAEILALAPDLNFSGVVFLSAMFDRASQAYVPGNDMPYLLYLPTMAAVARYHKKVNSDTRTEGQCFYEAVKFSQNEYAAALMKGRNITFAEKKRLASRLAAITGLSTKQFLDSNLRISNEAFQSLLLASKGERLGQLDGRISTTVKPVSATPSPYNDPSFASTINTSVMNPISIYFTDSLQFPAKGKYVSLNLKANFNWTWPATNGVIEYWTVAPYVAAAMQKHPQMRILVVGGYFDLATPLYATMYTLDHVGADFKRITILNFSTGHDTFDTEENLKLLTD
ncbi:MAG: S10 family serine carboxypeptidase-like protein, partial [Mucilaginibacter sp.]